ncbi:MAG: transcription initiation protein [Candidatus Eremiobacteraeota bacterium]|nr:transcription initiation protein [Candidatus Eremiobacteraeota bacterium]
MSEYVYLYRGGRRAESPAEGEQQMQAWMTWLKDLAAKGHIKDQGQPLEPEGKVVRANRSVTDGPYAESKDIIGGYTLVEAKDLAQAADLASGCPIFRYDGLVEVRPVMKM